MPPEAVIAAHPSDPDLTTAPEFALSLWRNPDPSEIDVIVNFKNNLGQDPASPALMHGLAILIADQQGYLHKVADQLQANGPLSEAQVGTYITMLIEGAANEQPC